MMIKRLLIGTLLFSFFFLTGMQYPQHGTDYNAYRCAEGLASKGDRVQDVIDMCGEPIREDSLGTMPPTRILIYQFDQSHVYYFEFAKDILTRIYEVNCLQDDPDCE
jgi:hypothetical protein